MTDAGSHLDLEREYEAYLVRVQEATGDTEFGAFVKFSGRLVKKMRFEEFAPAYTEYHRMASQYLTALDRGDTINDVIVRVIRERAAELFLTSPV